MCLKQTPWSFNCHSNVLVTFYYHLTPKCSRVRFYSPQIPGWVAKDFAKSLRRQIHLKHLDQTYKSHMILCFFLSVWFLLIAQTTETPIFDEIRKIGSRTDTKILFQWSWNDLPKTQWLHSRYSLCCNSGCTQWKHRQGLKAAIKTWKVTYSTVQLTISGWYNQGAWVPFTAWR